MIRNKLNTLVETMEVLKKEGYTDDFKAEDDAIYALYSGKKYQPGDLTIIKTFRFEGFTDPGDQTDLYAIEAGDGIKGTMTMAYGMQQSQNTDLVKQIRIRR